MTQPPELDYGDVQGLVRFGHGRLEDACYLLLDIADAAAARAWLRTAPVTTAVTMTPPPDTALQIAFTSKGLRRLGVPDAVIDAFSDEFRAGMADEPSRSRRLGDIGANAPAGWEWGGSDAAVPDLVVMLFARRGQLAAWEQASAGPDWPRAFTVRSRLPTNDIGDIEPFGFADGVSQPKIDWSFELDLDGRERLEFGNVLALGEVLLGYPNEYGLLTDRPLLDPAFDPAAEILPPALDTPNRRDLGRNGSYVVFRQLAQDVRRFWQFVDQAAGGDPQKRWALADSMVGRHRDGAPLVPSSTKLIAGIGVNRREHENNGFLYEDDLDGIRCPFGAHIRRTNPRTGDLPGGQQPLWRRLLRRLGFKRSGLRDDLIASTRFHRLVRRGREYGPALPPEEALRPGPDEPRGLQFICLVANISRQFEFVQNAWVSNAKFDGLSDESDPLLGNREPLHGGGAYFFLPGIRALRYIAEAGA